MRRFRGKNKKDYIDSPLSKSTPAREEQQQAPFITPIMPEPPGPSPQTELYCSPTKAVSRAMAPDKPRRNALYRLVCRARPAPLHPPHSDARVDVLQNNKVVLTHIPDPTATPSANAARNQPQTFEYDELLGQRQTQDDVYLATAHQALPAFTTLNRQYLCLCYGVTGSGKTYSMFGTSRDPGILPRFLEDLWGAVGGNDTVSVELAALELVPAAKAKQEAQTFSMKRGSKKGKIELKSDKISNSEISRKGLTTGSDLLEWMEMQTQEQCLEWLKALLSLRQSASTEINQNSSRSHLLVMVRVSDGSVSRIATFGDLAGTERHERAKATGVTKMQGTSINVSITALNRCLVGLRNGTGTITTRECLLTRVLAPYLDAENPRDAKMDFLLTVGGSGTYHETKETLSMGAIREIIATPRVEVRRTPARTPHMASPATPVVDEFEGHSREDIIEAYNELRTYSKQMNDIAVKLAAEKASIEDDLRDEIGAEYEVWAEQVKASQANALVAEFERGLVEGQRMVGASMLSPETGRVITYEDHKRLGQQLEEANCTPELKKLRKDIKAEKVKTKESDKIVRNLRREVENLRGDLERATEQVVSQRKLEKRATTAEKNVTNLEKKMATLSRIGDELRAELLVQTEAADRVPGLEREIQEQAAAHAKALAKVQKKADANAKKSVSGGKGKVSAAAFSKLQKELKDSAAELKRVSEARIELEETLKQLSVERDELNAKVVLLEAARMHEPAVAVEDSGEEEDEEQQFDEEEEEEGVPFDATDFPELPPTAPVDISDEEEAASDVGDVAESEEGEEDVIAVVFQRIDELGVRAASRNDQVHTLLEKSNPELFEGVRRRGRTRIALQALELLIQQRKELEVDDVDEVEVDEVSSPQPEPTQESSPEPKPTQESSPEPNPTQAMTSPQASSEVVVIDDTEDAADDEMMWRHVSSMTASKAATDHKVSHFLKRRFPQFFRPGGLSLYRKNKAAVLHFLSLFEEEEEEEVPVVPSRKRKARASPTEPVRKKEPLALVLPGGESSEEEESEEEEEVPEEVSVTTPPTKLDETPPQEEDTDPGSSEEEVTVASFHPRRVTRRVAIKRKKPEPRVPTPESSSSSEEEADSSRDEEEIVLVEPLDAEDFDEGRMDVEEEKEEVFVSPQVSPKSQESSSDEELEAAEVSDVPEEPPVRRQPRRAARKAAPKQIVSPDLDVASSSSEDNTPVKMPEPKRGVFSAVKKNPTRVAATPPVQLDIFDFTTPHFRRGVSAFGNYK